MLTVCGCGEQGRFRLKALSRVCRLQHVFAFDNKPEQAEKLAEELTDALEIPVTPVRDLPRPCARATSV